MREAAIPTVVACYHPLFLFNQFGDLERCALRPGNVHSADGWKSVLDPVVVRYRSKVSRIYFRADAGFANSDVYEYLEAERIKYAIRLPANRVLQERIGYLLKRPVGRPSLDVRRSYANFTYQAASWSKPAGLSPRSSGIPVNSHERMRQRVESRQGGGNDERPDLARVPEIVPRRARECADCGPGLCARASTVRLALPLVTTRRSGPRSDRSAGTKRHGRLRARMEASKSRWHDWRSDMAAVLEAMPRPDVWLVVGLDCAGARPKRRAGSSPNSCADTERVIVPLATAGGPDTRSGQLQRPAARSRRRVCATSSVSMPGSDRRVGQRTLAHLPLPRNA